jgi:hypothetical protein
MNEEIKYKCKDLNRNSKAITDMMLIKRRKYKWGSNPDCPHHTLARYQLRYCVRHDGQGFSNLSTHSEKSGK